MGKSHKETVDFLLGALQEITSEEHKKADYGERLTTVVSIRTDLLGKVKALHKDDTGISMSDIVNKAIEEWIPTYELRNGSITPIDPNTRLWGGGRRGSPQSKLQTLVRLSIKKLEKIKAEIAQINDKEAS